MSQTTNNAYGVLLVNLGSPDSTNVADVRRYLDEFLMDERVIDAPKPIRRFLVSTFILPFRPKKSVHAYQTIWWKEGSPLIVISRSVQKLVQQKVDFPVELGMRYGNPSIEAGLRALVERGVRDVLLIPQYPHYAMATYETVVEKTKNVLAKNNLPLNVRYYPPFYDDPRYIEALAASALPHLDWPYDHVLFSYHGVPVRHLRKTDPTGHHCYVKENCCEVASPAHALCYRHQVVSATHAIAQKLGIPKEKYSISFQSRLGPDQWMEPFTDKKMQQLAESGIQKLAVLCPAFVADCLETLEEIGIRGREVFLQAGGEDFRMIPCMNDAMPWIDLLADWSNAQKKQ